MTTVETISACENVCRDFSWFWSGLSQLWPRIIDATPALTLFFAVITFFIQRHTDRKAELIKIKREIYVKLLRQLNIAYFDIPNEEGWDRDERYLKLRGLAAEVALLRESVDLSPHIRQAIEAIEGKNDPDRRGKRDPHGKGGPAHHDNNRGYTGKPWPFNLDVFETSIGELEKYMREDLATRSWFQWFNP